MEVIFNIEAEEDFRLLVDDILNGIYNEHNSSKIINENTVAAAKEEIKDVIFKTHCNAQSVLGILLSKGFEKKRSELVSSLIESRACKLLYSTLLNYNSTHGETISTFDWAVKLAYGTSELKHFKYPFLQLAFTTLCKGHQQQRIYDINKDTLANMICVLENIDMQS